MEELVRIGQAFVEAMRNREGIRHVDEVYSENAQSVEAVTPPVRDLRISKGRGAIRAKRADWAKAHDIIKLEADGPYVHPPNRFGVRFKAEVVHKESGRRMILREIAVYSVEEGKITREEFFLFPK